MTKTVELCLCAALLTAAAGVRAQDAPPKAPEQQKAPGKRLQVRFLETRQRGSATTASHVFTLVLHADAGRSSMNVGAQVPILVSDKDGPSTLIKNAGVEAQASVVTLGDGRYALDARFEESSVLGTGSGAAATAGGNPILLVVKGQSKVTLSEGETVPFVSAVDPVTGETVRVDLVATAAPPARPAPTVGREEGQLRAQLVLVRRQSGAATARRPYSVALPTGGEVASVFGGSMLPLQLRINDRSTIVFKEIGSGLRLKAERIPDGRYRLDASFSDGVLAPGKDLPQIRAFESESQLFLQAGETVLLASGVDPQTGEVVLAELSLERLR
jgi:hypothetical protein